MCKDIHPAKKEGRNSRPSLLYSKGLILISIGVSLQELILNICWNLLV